MPQPETITMTEATQSEWDVLVIGAGPSGAIAARQCALAGARVLLVNEHQLPRGKVCGCCLNGAALQELDRIGLGDLAAQCRAPRLERFVLASGRRHVPIVLDGGVSLSRERLDLELTNAAVRAGAALLVDTRASISQSDERSCTVRLKQSSVQEQANARIVIVAAGLGRRMFSDQVDDPRATDPGSRIGAGAILDHAFEGYAPHTIYMACDPSGYVGFVRLEDGRLDMAAALDADEVKQAGGIGSLTSRITQSAGLPMHELVESAHWRGTAKLSQTRPMVFGDRFFVVGDAAGYVEPFTGEGMAWALASGIAVAPLALKSLDAGTVHTGPQWAMERKRLLGGRMSKCRVVSRLLRYPRLVRSAAWGLSYFPMLARPLVKSLNRPFTR